MLFSKIFATAFILVSAVIASPNDEDQDGRSLRAGKGTDTCGKLDQCYLVNVNSGKKVSLSAGGTVAMDKMDDQHTIICDTNGKIDNVTFTYNGKKHFESVKPWSLAGDTKDITHTVPWLTQAGKKEIKVTGKRDNNVCFEKTFSYEVYSDISHVPDHSRDLARVIIIAECDDCGCIVIVIIMQ